MMRDKLILFSVKREFQILLFVIRDLKVCVIREEPELLTDVRDFTTQLYVILRREFFEWLQWSIENALGMQFAIWNLKVPLKQNFRILFYLLSL